MLELQQNVYEIKQFSWNGSEDDFLSNNNTFFSGQACRGFSNLTFMFDCTRRFGKFYTDHKTGLHIIRWIFVCNQK